MFKQAGNESKESGGVSRRYGEPIASINNYESFILTTVLSMYSKRSLSDVSFIAKPGEISAVVGPDPSELK